jgi:uncharacterized protein YgiM (DUF1202 family)
LCGICLLLLCVQSAFASSSDLDLAFVDGKDAGQAPLWNTMSKDARSLGVYYNGTMVKLLSGHTEPGWQKVQIGALIGYIRAEFLAGPGDHIDLTIKEARIKVQGRSWVNVRALPDLRAKILRRAYAGDPYLIYGEVDNGFCYMGYNNFHGFIKAEYLEVLPKQTSNPAQETARPEISQEGTERNSPMQDKLAIVNNPDPKDRLHLRKKPTVSSQSLGKYYNGVVVTILEEYNNAEWMKVRIGTLVGYMQRKYLETSAASASVLSARPSVMVSNSSGKGLHLREYPRISSTSLGLFANGTQALVLGITEQWYHVQIGDEFGFMSAHGITLRLQYDNSVDAKPQKPNTKAKKAIVTSEVYMYKYDSENNLEVITTLPTGEVVTVLSSDSNGWSKVSNGIRVGYFLTKYLKFK